VLRKPHHVQRKKTCKGDDNLNLTCACQWNVQGELESQEWSILDRRKFNLNFPTYSHHVPVQRRRGRTSWIRLCTKSSNLSTPEFAFNFYSCIACLLLPSYIREIYLPCLNLDLFETKVEVQFTMARVSSGKDGLVTILMGRNMTSPSLSRQSAGDIIFILGATQDQAHLAPTSTEPYSEHLTQTCRLLDSLYLGAFFSPALKFLPGSRDCCCRSSGPSRVPICFG
jgi:hypothetical protein